MIKHKDSHLDHGLTEAQTNYLFEVFADRKAFFIETIELPVELGTVPCALFGPAMGDEPIMEAEVAYGKRGDRKHTSRLVDRALRPSNKVTVIAGPHDGNDCVLYTAFGGPPSPQEPADPTCKDLEASRKFWSVHALSSNV